MDAANEEEGRDASIEYEKTKVRVRSRSLTR
jgi:hypothetical protein